MIRTEHQRKYIRKLCVFFNERQTAKSRSFATVLFTYIYFLTFIISVFCSSTRDTLNFAVSQKIQKSPGKETRVLNFFPVQKLIFVHFRNCKKWNLVKKIFREIDLFDFTSFLAWTFFKFSGLLTPVRLKAENLKYVDFSLCKVIIYCTIFSVFRALCRLRLGVFENKRRLIDNRT